MFILEGPASTITEILSSDEETTVTKSAKRDAPTCDLSAKRKTLKDLRGHRRKAFDPEWLQMFPWLKFSQGLSVAQEVQISNSIV